MKSNVLKVTCSIDGCEKPCLARGWCSMHYWRWRRQEGPLIATRTPDARFWAKVDKAGPDGYHSQTGENLGPCWLWTAAQNGWGYGKLRVADRTVRAHIFSYELLVGPIPPGLDLDHLCRVRHCVHPDHLEPVTRRENLLRGNTIPARHAAKTVCPQGHEFSPENTSLERGKRRCRACQRERNRVNGAKASRKKAG